MQKLSDKLIEAGYTKELAGDDFQKILDAVSSVANSTSKAGMIMLGNVGCGKTTAIKAIVGIVGSFVFVDMSDVMCHKLLEPHIADRRINNGVYEKDGWWTIVDDETVIIDDLGSESMQKNYGTPKEVFSTFIMKFYADSYNKPDKEARLFITSNLTEKELEDRYGTRTMDRVYAMCTPVTLKQKSHRKYHPRF